jgi:hypothetical protein
MAERKSTTSKKPATKKTASKVATKVVKAPHSDDNNWTTSITKFNRRTSPRIIILLVIVAGIFLLNPQAGIINQNQNDTPDNKQSYKVDIRNRVLSDPKEGDLKVHIGSRSVLQITTDEDGRLNLVSTERDVFNPIFSNVTNTLSVPTDRAELFRIEFYPVSATDTNAKGIVIGTVIVQN